jgi:hypothetical protein
MTDKRHFRIFQAFEGYCATKMPQKATYRDALVDTSRPVKSDQQAYPALEDITKPMLNTADAAHYLNRQPKTLRAWACHQSAAPILPTRINGRLAWSVTELRRLLQVEQ